MHTLKKHIILFFFFLLIGMSIKAQTPQELEARRIENVELRLDEYAIQYPKIKSKKVDVDVNTSLEEFAIAVTRESKVSMTIHPDIKGKVNISLSEAPISDVLLYLCKAYSLDLDFSGSIISLIPYEAPKPKKEAKKVDVKYTAFSKKLEINLNNDTLDMVLEEISRQSGRNIIATKEVSNQIVGGYIGATDFEDALRQLAIRNDLELNENEKGFFEFSKKQKEVANNPNNPNNRNNSRNSSANKNNSGYIKSNVSSDTTGLDLISLEVDDAQLSEVIRDVSNKLGVDYYLYTDMTETVSIRIKDLTYDDFLKKILQGTKYEFNYNNDVYLIGDAFEDNLFVAEVVQLEHRSVKEVTKAIPDDLMNKDIKVKEFNELNALMVSGSKLQVEKLKDFINDLDRPVPVVEIELLIIDVNRTRSTSTGVEAGISSEPVPSGGTLFPGINFTFSSSSVNQLLDIITGTGVVNLGQVTPNFYATLQAVESSGLIKVRQTPRLSTLNGKEATFKNGETRYYLEQNTFTTPGLNTVVETAQVFKAVEANFEVKIEPFVSGDENVTLDISVQQESFVGQLLPNAPPPTVSRGIESSIRVKNGEMIVLGGLESISIEESGQGVPVIQRIPVLKWFFSKRTRGKTKTKLLIFVKPTIVYE